MKIPGNTVGTTMPRSNYNQTNPKKADYLIGRENIVGKDELASVTEDILAQAKARGEFDGADGKDGYTPVKGVDYFDGEDGEDGKDGYTPVKGVDYFDGKDGKDGKDGVPCTHSWDGSVLTITSASGTSSADLKGQDGNQGISPTISVSKSGKVTTVTITDANGTKSVQINDGEDGADGVVGDLFTEYTSGIWKVRKWSNGTCELWASVYVEDAVTTAWGNIYQGNNVLGAKTFPVTFAEAPMVQVSCVRLSGDVGSPWLIPNDSTQNTTTTQVGHYNLVSASKITSAKAHVDYYVRGTLA